MKYQQTDKSFMLLINGEYRNVTPFNAEVTKYKPMHGNKMINDVSWSHGKTHFIDNLTGDVMHCGQEYFEQNATEVI